MCVRGAETGGRKEGRERRGRERQKLLPIITVVFCSIVLKNSDSKK